jgi:hypothetical protein
MAKKTTQDKRKPGQRKPIVYKRQAVSLHNAYYVRKLKTWIETANLTRSEVKALQSFLQKYMKTNNQNNLFFRPKNRHYEPTILHHFVAREDIDPIVQELFGVSFLPKWDKYNRKAGRIKYI